MSHTPPELTIPPSAAAVLRLADSLVRRAALAADIAARTSPPAPAGFGARLISRFTTVGDPRPLAGSIVARFALAESDQHAA
ncbi:MAG TPA: hypothetical protein VNL77_15190, partial [Roseiflexaceae bacterium]|nr:hypothetical protein [Roseiflexaceae bacterium]